MPGATFAAILRVRGRCCPAARWPLPCVSVGLDVILPTRRQGLRETSELTLVHFPRRRGQEQWCDLLFPNEEHVEHTARSQLIIVNDHRGPLVAVPVAVLVATPTRDIGCVDSDKAGLS